MLYKNIHNLGVLLHHVQNRNTIIKTSYQYVSVRSFARKLGRNREYLSKPAIDSNVKVIKREDAVDLLDPSEGKKFAYQRILRGADYDRNEAHELLDNANIRDEEIDPKDICVPLLNESTKSKIYWLNKRDDVVWSYENLAKYFKASVNRVKAICVLYQSREDFMKQNGVLVLNNKTGEYEIPDHYWDILKRIGAVFNAADAIIDEKNPPKIKYGPEPVLTSEGTKREEEIKKIQERRELIRYITLNRLHDPRWTFANLSIKDREILNYLQEEYDPVQAEEDRSDEKELKEWVHEYEEDVKRQKKKAVDEHMERFRKGVNDLDIKQAIYLREYAEMALVRILPKLQSFSEMKKVEDYLQQEIEKFMTTKNKTESNLTSVVDLTETEWEKICTDRETLALLVKEATKLQVDDDAALFEIPRFDGALFEEKVKECVEMLSSKHSLSKEEVERIFVIMSDHNERCGNLFDYYESVEDKKVQLMLDGADINFKEIPQSGSKLATSYSPQLFGDEEEAEVKKYLLKKIAEEKKVVKPIDFDTYLDKNYDETGFKNILKPIKKDIKYDDQLKKEITAKSDINISRWKLAFKDTSASVSQSTLIRTRSGSLREASPLEEASRSWSQRPTYMERLIADKKIQKYKDPDGDDLILQQIISRKLAERKAKIGSKEDKK